MTSSINNGTDWNTGKCAEQMIYWLWK